MITVELKQFLKCEFEIFKFPETRIQGEKDL